MLIDNPIIIESAILFSGLAVLLLNLLFVPSVFVKNGALNIFPNKYQYFELVKTNWLVLGNSIAVHLQQSIFLFALPGFVTPLYLSAYGFIDKLISSFRMVINAYSAAIIPNATQKYLQGLDFWKKMKLQQNLLLASFCLIAGIFMYFFPDQIIAILLFGKKENSLFINQVVELLRFISPVPLLIALNVLNVLELFLEKKYTAYFGTGLVILVIAMSCLVALKLGLPQFMTGFYPLLIEGASCIITWLIVNKIRNEKK
jgi:O-antigen/teichoic acid export membrane protein